MENTKNLNLKIPEQTDFYDIQDFNNNMKILDQFAGRKDNPHGVTAEQTGAIKQEIFWYRHTDGINNLLEYILSKIELGYTVGIIEIAFEQGVPSDMPENTLNRPSLYGLCKYVKHGFQFVEVTFTEDYGSTTFFRKIKYNTTSDGEWLFDWKEIISNDGYLHKTGGKVSGEIATPSYFQLTGYKLLENVDLNTVKYTGQYGATVGCANHPTGIGYGMLEVVMYSSHWLIQRFTSINEQGVIDGIWYRSYHNNKTWTSWEKFDMRTTNTLANAEEV